MSVSTSIHGFSDWRLSGQHPLSPLHSLVCYRTSSTDSALIDTTHPARRTLEGGLAVLRSPSEVKEIPWVMRSYHIHDTSVRIRIPRIYAKEESQGVMRVIISLVIFPYPHPRRNQQISYRGVARWKRFTLLNVVAIPGTALELLQLISARTPCRYWSILTIIRIRINSVGISLLLHLITLPVFPVIRYR